VFQSFCTVCKSIEVGSLPAIPSGHSTDQSTIRPDDVDFRPNTHLHREAYVPACIRSDQVQIREDCCNRPDDVDSRPDSLTHKARIVIQIQPSERQSAMVRTRAQQIWKLRVEDQPSGRPSPSPDVGSLSKEITCSGRATVRTTVPHHPDAALKQERFSVKISKFW